MKSKSVLFKLLVQKWPEKSPIQIGTNSISDETYGRKSFLYFWNITKEWGMSRDGFERMLEGWGFKVNKRYGRGLGQYRDYDATEVQVSYFKGWHHDE